MSADGYLKERIAAGIKSQDPVFASTYDGMRMFLRRLGNQVLKRRVYPHLFRHSSATFYATRLNRQELCYRYGWKFSSNMPDIYISRAGMENNDIDLKFTNTELGQLKDELATVRQEAKIKEDTIEKMSKIIAHLQTNLEAINQVLAKNPTVKDLETALQRKRAKGSGDAPHSI